MLGLPPNTVQDQVAPLNLHGFRGNDFPIQLNVMGDAPMPAVVECIVSYEGSKKPWPVLQQPTVDISNRSITVQFIDTEFLPEKAFHVIRFDGRTVMSGKLLIDRETIPGVSNSQQVNLTLTNGSVVNVTVLVGPSSGGGGQSISYTLTNVVTGRYRHNFGRVPSVTVVNSLGAEIGAALRHIYETGSTITNEIEITSNQPITGRLILHA